MSISINTIPFVHILHANKHIDPPSKIRNISVVSYSWVSASSLLHVELSWDPPAVVNGVLRGYNVSIGTRPLEELEEPVGDFHITDITPSASTNSSVSLSTILNFPDVQCLYIQVSNAIKRYICMYVSVFIENLTNN